MLIKKHHYHSNTRVTKEIGDRFQVNHDSDEMASLSFFTLMRYEEDTKLRDEYYIEACVACGSTTCRNATRSR